MRKVTLLIIIFLFASQIRAANINEIIFNKTAFRKYEKVEATFQLDQTCSNPNNPDIVTVDAMIDDGIQTFEFPCFYYVPVNYKSLTENFDQAVWKFRFAFRKEGTYRIWFRVQDSTVTFSDTTAIIVSDANGRGFVRWIL